MNVFKKIISTAVATATLLMGTAFPVSATTYDTRDIDRNGYIEVTDYVSLSKFLIGNKYMYDNSLIDVDGNSIVSAIDNECIISGLLQTSFSNRVKGTSKVFTSSETTNIPTTNYSTSQLYAKYNYSNKSESTYNLSLQESNNLTASAFVRNVPGILGPDSREADALEGIVRLSSGGTGFIVDDHVIATSAHCVYSTINSEWVSDMYIYLPDEDGCAIMTEPITVKEAHMPNIFKTNRSDKYDYALLTVSEDLSEYYHFNLGMPYNIYTNEDFEKYTIYSTGYSSTIPDGETEDQKNNELAPQMYTGEGKLINEDYVDKTLLCYDTDITFGNSGGPVYVKETYLSENDDSVETITVISICSGIVNTTGHEHNTGPIMSAIMLKFFMNNSNILY